MRAFSPIRILPFQMHCDPFLFPLLRMISITRRPPWLVTINECHVPGPLSPPWGQVQQASPASQPAQLRDKRGLPFVFLLSRGLVLGGRAGQGSE